MNSFSAIRLSVLVLLLTGLLLSTQAYANLLISPTKTTFLDNDRTKEIILINDGTETQTYRISWIERKVTESGDVRGLTDQELKTYPIASKYLRFSPRQVTLKPQERQTIKLVLRRAKNMADGDYRSYLMMQALPNQKQIDTVTQDAGIQLNMLMSYALPVVIRQGQADASVTMGNQSFSYNTARKSGQVSVELSRTGRSSTVGNLVAYWKPTAGTERVIARINDLSLYPEVTTRQLNLAWVGAEFSPSAGTLRIVYEGIKEYKDRVFVERSFTLSSSQIKLVNN